jgi:hypothetical protein
MGGKKGLAWWLVWITREGAVRGVGGRAEAKRGLGICSVEGCCYIYKLKSKLH